MAKPLPSHIWHDIRTDFERGMSQADIRKKYDVGAGTLGNKIKREGWRLSHEQTSVITEFKEASVKISESFHTANETQKKEIIERVQTILEDNEIIHNNRKLAKAFQSLIGNGINSGLYETPQDIKTGTAAIKDLEAISNPQASKIEINNTNAQQGGFLAIPTPVTADEWTQVAQKQQTDVKSS